MKELRKAWQDAITATRSITNHYYKSRLEALIDDAFRDAMRDMGAKEDDLYI